MSTQTTPSAAPPLRPQEPPGRPARSGRTATLTAVLLTVPALLCAVTTTLLRGGSPRRTA
ncbi:MULTISPECIES: hypothetical protein [Streptomyces]|uniref:Uncharacterized protein n=1 Tax=Streptomyces virginiae TaxID=1961 RepID=A0ABZ1TDT3_STRVG|nr:hypothetical protein [Streptomyces virginiae]